MARFTLLPWKDYNGRMGKRGPKPGTMKARPRDKTGRYVPVSEPIKSWPVDQVLASIEKNFGLKTQVAQDLGASLGTIVRYGKEIEAVRLAFWSQKERVKDLAELSLYGAIQKGEAWAVCFFLKTQAKDRGYIERQEVSGEGGGPINVVHTVLIERLQRIIEAEADSTDGIKALSNGEKPS